MAVQQPRRAPIRHHGHHSDGDHGFPRRMGAMKQHNNNNGAKLTSMLGGGTGPCASNGLNIHSAVTLQPRQDVTPLPGSTITCPQARAPSHTGGPTCPAGNGSSSGQNGAGRKNSKPVNMLRPSSDTSDSTGCSGGGNGVPLTTTNDHNAPTYVQNTPNVHLFGLHA